MKVLASILLDSERRLAAKDLATHVEDLKSSIATSLSATAERRLALTQEATKLHALYRQIIERSIRILEQTIHGSVARGTKARADYLATVAEGMDKKLSVQHGQLMSPLYSTDVQEVMKSKREGLNAKNRSTKWKVRDAEQQLEEYRSAGGMENLAKEYAEILREGEKVKAEIEKLKHGASSNDS